MKPFCGIFVLSLLLLSPSAGPAASPADSPVTLDSVLRKYVDALGGKDAIEKLRTRRLGGELTHDYPGQDPQKTVLSAEVIAAAPDRWRLVLKTSAGVQQMGFDGRRGFTQDADRVLIDNRQARSRLAYLFNPQGAVHLEEYFSQLSLQGKTEFEGRPEYAVKTAGSATPMALYFDAETGLLNRLGENIRIKEYRREGGVLHPAEIVITREGGMSTYHFDDISANIPVEEARFAVPGLGDVFPEAFEGLDDPGVVPLLKDFPSVHEEMNIPCRDGRFLHDLIVRNGYKKGLEIGSFTGYSALWMGLALKRTGGRLVTIEYEEGSGLEARKNLRRAGLDAFIDSRIADAFDEIPKLEGNFDFVFIDADKRDYLRFLKLVRDRVVPGGAIVAHNVTNYAHDMQDYLEAVRADPGLETTFDTTSGEGMSVSKVRDRVSPPQAAASKPAPPLISVEDMRHDFDQLRRILENEHCCVYEYTPKTEFDGIFNERRAFIDRPMRYEEFFKIVAPLAAKVGCMHTALWMAPKFLGQGSNNLFPLQVRLIENLLVVTGSYRDEQQIPAGSVLLEINGVPADRIFDDLKSIASADAFNPHFVQAQVEKRFPVFYASLFGFPDKYTVTYALPGRKTRETADLRPADLASVRKVIFANFNHPPLTLDVLPDKKTAVMTVRTFSYYDRVEYFKDFMDKSFRRIKDEGIANLILDLRGNDGGDPWCAVILYSYLEREPAPNFAEPYGSYAELAKPVPLPENRFTGGLYTLLDGRCGSTNGHFAALLKYHGLGTFVGMPSGSTYKCNAGKNTELALDKTSLILTLGRSTYAAAVKGMDKAKPIMPDVPVAETYKDFLAGKDVFMDAALKLIADRKK